MQDAEDSCKPTYEVHTACEPETVQLADRILTTVRGRYEGPSRPLHDLPALGVARPLPASVPSLDHDRLFLIPRTKHALPASLNAVEEYGPYRYPGLGIANGQDHCRLCNVS